MLRGLALSPLLVASLALGGCSDQACIQWSEAEGVCPARSEAIEYMGAGGAGCGIVTSVDSEGEFDGQACCYDVTERDDDEYYCVPSSGPTAGPATTSVSSSSSSSSSGGATPTCTGDTCFPECGAPIESPSAGSCFAIDSVSTFCNPVTNEGCTSLQTCDLYIDDFGVNYLCYPTSFFGSLCTQCASWGQCSVGYGCFIQCAKYCCNEADCGELARCDMDHLASLGMSGGVCVDDFSQGGSGPGGAGGQGGAGAGGSPAGGSGGI